VLGAVALMIALGGVAYAGSMVNGADILPGTITGEQVKNRSLEGADVANDTIGFQRLKPDVRSAFGAGGNGATGPQGARGATGAQGATGISGTKGATGVKGATGQKGATGPKGVTGAAGVTGPAGPALPFAYGANTTGQAFATLVAAGTPIPLPNAQNLNGFIVDGSNTQFTATTAGTYRVSFAVRLASNSQSLGAKVMKNGVAVPGLASVPNDVGSGVRLYDGDAIVQLVAGDVLELRLFPGSGSATTLDTDTGATLTIQGVG